ncbi:MAG: PTS sugar transporter subunit IIA [Bacteroides sp.]|nr:PTS sugar transporter subunit IIA [Prevotella sp.]MCM1406982.1 PTS sugar transporter subunit IIA [Treponema brennaborense]MCM1470133.1 PTS sugar transporter subunit IIA [Bacteroides sp.]
MIFNQVFHPSAIKVPLESADREEAFRELIEVLVSKNPGADREKIRAVIESREQKMSTGIKCGIAVPHGKTDQIRGVQCVVGISPAGIDYGALDGKPVHIIFLLMSSPSETESYLQTLKRLARVFEIPSFYETLLSLSDRQAVYDALCRYEELLQ